MKEVIPFPYRTLSPPDEELLARVREAMKDMPKVEIHLPSISNREEMGDELPVTLYPTKHLGPINITLTKPRYPNNTDKLTSDFTMVNFSTAEPPERDIENVVLRARIAYLDFLKRMENNGR